MKSKFHSSLKAELQTLCDMLILTPGKDPKDVAQRKLVQRILERCPDEDVMNKKTHRMRVGTETLGQFLFGVVHEELDHIAKDAAARASGVAPAPFDYLEMGESEFRFYAMAGAGVGMRHDSASKELDRHVIDKIDNYFKMKSKESYNVYDYIALNIERK